ncbi:hypothetical protein [Campylobacter concisus]|nr:hypothetical protein [Campylobacter concisus]
MACKAQKSGEAIKAEQNLRKFRNFTARNDYAQTALKFHGARLKR